MLGVFESIEAGSAEELGCPLLAMVVVKCSSSLAGGFPFFHPSSRVIIFDSHDTDVGPFHEMFQEFFLGQVGKRLVDELDGKVQELLELCFGLSVGE